MYVTNGRFRYLYEQLFSLLIVKTTKINEQEDTSTDSKTRHSLIVYVLPVQLYDHRWLYSEAETVFTFINLCTHNKTWYVH